MALHARKTLQKKLKKIELLQVLEELLGPSFQVLGNEPRRNIPILVTLKDKRHFINKHHELSFNFKVKITKGGYILFIQ